MKRFLLGGRFFVLFVTFLCSCDDKLSEGVDISDIPSYYFEKNYLDERITKINDAISECTDGCESFFWITDIHWEPDLNTRKSPLLIKYIASKTLDKLKNVLNCINKYKCRKAYNHKQ